MGTAEIKELRYNLGKSVGSVIEIGKDTVLIKRTTPTHKCELCYFNDVNTSNCSAPKVGRVHDCFAHTRADRESVFYITLKKGE